MERSRVTRYLRIAVTALSLTACILLIGLWVRSYWWLDSIRFSSLHIQSWQGSIYLFALPDTYPLRRTHIPGYALQSFASERLATPITGGVMGSTTAVEFSASSTRLGPLFPYWMCVLAVATMAALPWLPKYSLRTLLIAMTLVAVGLGVIVASQ